MAAPTKAALTFQASTSNAAAGTAIGTSQDLTTAFEAEVIGTITNGATGPTVGCDFVVDVSNDGNNWDEFMRVTASTAANAVSVFPVYLPAWVMYARTRFTGNTAQAVTVMARGSKVSTVG